MKKNETGLNAQLPTVGIVGLGIMGGIMAETLLLNKYRVVGFDIEKSACARLKKAGGQVAKSVAQVTEQADVLITSLATSNALRMVYQVLFLRSVPSLCRGRLLHQALPLSATL